MHIMVVAASAMGERAASTALAKELIEKHTHGSGLDWLELSTEPPPHLSPDYENNWLLPHQSIASRQARGRYQWLQRGTGFPESNTHGLSTLIARSAPSPRAMDSSLTDAATDTAGEKGKSEP